MDSHQPSLEERHEREEGRDGKETVKYAFAFQNLDWDDYHRHRPAYPDSLFAMWLDYHRSHGGEFGEAHDLGAGPGTVAAVLASTFAHVFVSDAGANNLGAAAASLKPTSHFSFRHAPAEAADTWIPPSSIDLTSVGMAFHYMDADAALRSVAKTLKPGGTLAAVTYGFRLLFPGRPRAQQLWYDVVSTETARLFRGGKVFAAAVTGTAKAMTGLDFVPVPAELYEGVRRVYVNVREGEPRPFCFLDPDPALWTPATSGVADGEERVYVEDAAWGRQADGAWLRGFLASSQLGFGEATWATEGWKELEEIVSNSPEGQVEIRWPAAVLLATRR